MIKLFIVSSFLVITFLNVKYMIHYFNSLKVSVSTNNRSYVFGDHGPRTLFNSAQNFIFYNVFYLLLLIFYFLDSDNLILHILIVFIFFMALSSSTYRVSEVKHLVDGISDNDQSRIFFKRTFLSGIYHVIYILLSLFLYKINILWIVSIVTLSLFCFLFGMADLFQTRNINTHSRYYIFSQFINTLLNIPTNFFRMVFVGGYRNECIRSLVVNLQNIWRGIKSLF